MDRSDRSTFWLEGYSDRNKPNTDRHDMQNVNKAGPSDLGRVAIGPRIAPSAYCLLLTAYCLLLRSWTRLRPGFVASIVKFLFSQEVLYPHII